jgi:hypothetical protein
MKLLNSVNLTHNQYGLKRDNIRSYSGAVYIIGNFRRLFHSLGYDSSLLIDDEILAFQELVYEYEQNNDHTLIEVLDFLSK